MGRLKKGVLNGLIVFYLSVIYFAGVPESNTLNSRLRESALKVSFIFGIWPSWSMFAPNPVKFDGRTYAAIEYSDGSVMDADIEKDPDGILAPFRKARWMKYAQDNLRSREQRALLGPALRYLKRKHEISGVSIRRISIKREWFEISPFSWEKLHPVHQTPRETKAEVLITHTY